MIMMVSGLTEQVQMAVLQAKIRHMKNRASIATLVTVLSLAATVASFAVYVLISTGVGFPGYTPSTFRWDLVAIGCGGLGTAVTALCWARWVSADEEKQVAKMEVHEILLAQNFEFCPFCKKPLRPGKTPVIREEAVETEEETF